VSHDGISLPADVVVKSLDLLGPDAFETLLQSRDSVRNALPARSHLGG